MLALMVGFPSLFYYLYVCLFFYDGPSFLPHRFRRFPIDLPCADVFFFLSLDSGQLAVPHHALRLTGSGGWLDFVATIVSYVVNVSSSQSLLACQSMPI